MISLNLKSMQHVLKDHWQLLRVVQNSMKAWGADEGCLDGMIVVARGLLLDVENMLLAGVETVEFPVKQPEKAEKTEPG